MKRGILRISQTWDLSFHFKNAQGDRHWMPLSSSTKASRYHLRIFEPLQTSDHESNPAWIHLMHNLTAKDLWWLMPYWCQLMNVVTPHDHSMEITHSCKFCKRVLSIMYPVHQSANYDCVIWFSNIFKQVAEYVSRLFDWSQSGWQPSAASPVRKDESVSRESQRPNRQKPNETNG